jgi:hypothetical protein
VVLSDVTTTTEQPKSTTTRVSTVDNETYRLLEELPVKTPSPTYVNVTDLLGDTNGALPSGVSPTRVTQLTNNANSVCTSNTDNKPSCEVKSVYLSAQPDVVQSTQHNGTGSDVRCGDTVPVLDLVQESQSDQTNCTDSSQAQTRLPYSVIVASRGGSPVVSRLTTITVGKYRLPVLETDL